MTERDRIGGDGQNNGSETEGPEPEAELPELSDLSAVQADDALLDALGGADSQVADGLGDQELSALLLAWRRDVDSEAIPELVDTNSAVTTVRTAVVARTARGRGRRRMLVPVAAAAAVLAIGFTGTALAARDAEPGDTLWGLSTVLYADHARSVEAAASVRTDLDEAYLAIAQERFEDARRALGEAEQALHEVTSDELAQLRARHNELLAQLDRPEQPPAAPPVSSTENTSDSEESGTSTPSDTVSESSEDEEPPPELDETSSIPTTEPSVPSTEPSSPSTTTEDSTSDEESGSSRSGTSISGDTPTG
ncbi:anti-sigma-D factor RsdA [Saccharomonospora piscinae]|uniref:anti-sigma-D factor RsdA n=1 Tax=Saccharomonospora piscinae TaxID=687388 RepID=UPI000466C160|nr:anti-sigma-D factor RsdA [Saccharomonospora piscinae]